MIALCPVQKDDVSRKGPEDEMKKLQGRLAHGRIRPVSMSLVKKSAQRKVIKPAHTWLDWQYSPESQAAASLVFISNYGYLTVSIKVASSRGVNSALTT